MRVIGLLLLAPSAVALHLPARSRVSRRIAFAGSASAFAAINFPRRRAHAETLIDVVTGLEKAAPAAERNGEYWSTRTPSQSAKPGTPLTVRYVLMAGSEDDITYMWVRKSLPKAALGYVSIVTAARIKPGTSPVLDSLLPSGDYVPVAYSPSHGVWEGAPFRVGRGSRATTDGKVG